MEKIKPTRRLARFAADLVIDDIPDAVVSHIESLLLDWAGSALAGWSMHPVGVFDHFAREMGPKSGKCEILGGRRRTSALFAALVNGASSHVVEQDDLHNGSVLHPGTVVFPAALAAAQDRNASGEELLVAAIAGYEVGIRTGEFLGRSHYQRFHTTGTAGTIAAAVAVGRLIKLDVDRMSDAIGNAGTQAAGLWAFLADAANSKQLHTGKAAADGLLSAYMAEKGLTGAAQVLEGPAGMGAAMSSDADVERLTDELGKRWASAETSVKLHACCRHIHPAADALLMLMKKGDVKHSDLAGIEACVHQAAIDVLGAVNIPETVHQAKFSMGTALGLVAVHGKAGIDEFDRLALTDPDVARIRDATIMSLDPKIDAAYPRRWQGRVRVRTRDNNVLEGRIDHPKGDPDNPLTRRELVDKFRALASRASKWSETESDTLLRRIETVRSPEPLGSLL